MQPNQPPNPSNFSSFSEEKNYQNDLGKIATALYRSFCSEIIFQKIKINQILRAATLNIF